MCNHGGRWRASQKRQEPEVWSGWGCAWRGGCARLQRGAPLEDAWEIVHEALGGKVLMASPAVVVVEGDAVGEGLLEVEILERLVDLLLAEVMGRLRGRHRGGVGGDRCEEGSIGDDSDDDDDRSNQALSTVVRVSAVAHDLQTSSRDK
jgi:hypothetical protein